MKICFFDLTHGEDELIMGVADWLVKNFFNFLRFLKNSSLTSVVLGFVLPRVSAVDLLNR